MKYIIFTWLLVGCLFAFASQPQRQPKPPIKMIIPPLSSQAKKLNALAEEIEQGFKRRCKKKEENYLMKEAFSCH